MWLTGSGPSNACIHQSVQSVTGLACASPSRPAPLVMHALGLWKLSLGFLATDKEEERMAQCIIWSVEESGRSS